MLINKVTSGFVIQVFDTELKRFVSQEFVAGDECQYEDKDGVPACSEALETDGKAAYLPFDMVQPRPSRPPKACIRVEYDPDYGGGNYSKVGRFAYVPLDAIGAVPGSLTGDQRLKAAFQIVTGYDPAHIVHYTFDEVYDQDGNEWRDE